VPPQPRPGSRPPGAMRKHQADGAWPGSRPGVGRPVDCVDVGRPKAGPGRVDDRGDGQRPRQAAEKLGRLLTSASAVLTAFTTLILDEALQLAQGCSALVGGCCPPPPWNAPRDGREERPALSGPATFLAGLPRRRFGRTATATPAGDGRPPAACTPAPQRRLRRRRERGLHPRRAEPGATNPCIWRPRRKSSVSGKRVFRSASLPSVGTR